MLVFLGGLFRFPFAVAVWFVSHCPFEFLRNSSCIRLQAVASLGFPGDPVSTSNSACVWSSDIFGGRTLAFHTVTRSVASFERGTLFR